MGQGMPEPRNPPLTDVLFLSYLPLRKNTMQARRMILSTLLTLSYFVCPQATLAQTKSKTKPKVDLLAGIDAEAREQLATLPEGVQLYVAHRLAGGDMKGLLEANSTDAWRAGQVGIISYDASNLAEDKQAFEVNSIVDGRNAIIKDSSIWIEGLNTGGIVTGQPVSLAGHCFVVAGTKTYKTVLGGNRTVKHAIAVNTQSMNSLLAKIVEPQGYRVWVDQYGYSDIAKFRRKSGTSVALELVTGKSKTFPIKKLSVADQEWVKEQVEAAKEEKE